MKQLPASALDQPIEGRHIEGASTLAEILHEPTLFAFLRHCG